MKTIFVLSFLLVNGFFSFAQDNTPRADAREGAQRTRIVTGRGSGEVTGREAAALHHEQRHIQGSEGGQKTDGTVTRREKVRLERKQDRASRHIRRAKNNNIEK